MTTLSELCDIIQESIDPASAPNALCLGLEHVPSGRFYHAGHAKAADSLSLKYVFRPNDVLYGKLRPYLDKAVLAAEKGVCTTELLVLRPKPSVNPGFLISVIHDRRFIDYAVSGTTGAHHPRTSWHHIKDYALPEFNEKEQKIISTFVWKIHNALIAAERTIKSTEDLKRAAMRQLFTRGLRGEAQKETEFGLVPESWSIERLDNCARVVSTRMAYTELENAPQVSDEPTLLIQGIKVSDMNTLGNEINIEHTAVEKRLTEEVAHNRCAPPDTIIFPKRGAAIATNKKRITTHWSVFDPNLIGVIANEGISQWYLFRWFENFDLRTITEPGPTPQLNKKNLDPLHIPIPGEFDEQVEIASILGSIDQKIHLHRRKRAVLEGLFKSLLHKLMTGEIRVADLDLSALENRSAQEKGVTP